MAERGNYYLSNSTVINMYDTVKAYESTVLDALYSQYKTAFKISKSNYFRGDAADAFKDYISNGAINIISGMMDISSDLSMIIQIFAEAFYQYETNHSGKVEEGALDYINQNLNSKETTFEDAKSELNAVLQLAAQYISTQPLSLGTVNTGYSEVRNAVKKIREDLYAVDEEAVKAANELYTRITEMRTLIEKMMDFCYRDDGTINADNLNKITAQNWFSKTGNVTLFLMMEEDPFEYVAGETTLSENQWAAGLCSDVYAYAGYALILRSGEAGVENGTAFAKGVYATVQANGYAQFTDYLRAQANLKVAYAEGEGKIGFSEDYVGFKVEGEVGLVKVDGSVVLGSDDLNAYIKGDAKVLYADGKAAFEFEKDGQFAIGVDAEATVASAGIKGGTNIFSYKAKDSATGEKKPLLGFSVGAEADAGAGFALWAESDTAFETEYVNINATTVKIDAKALLGVEFSMTVPTPYFKSAW